MGGVFLYSSREHMFVKYSPKPTFAQAIKGKGLQTNGRDAPHPGAYSGALTYTADAPFRHGIARRFQSVKPTVYAQKSRDGSGRGSASFLWRRAGIQFSLPKRERSRQGRESVQVLHFNQLRTLRSNSK